MRLLMVSSKDGASSVNSLRNKHHVVFKACITLTQLLLNYGERSFKVERYDAKGLIDV